MAETTKDRFMVYATLAGFIAVAIISIFDYKNTHDLATDPHARSDLLSRADAIELRDTLRREYQANTLYLQKQIDQLKYEQNELIERYDLHIEWGRQRVIEDNGMLQRHEVQIQELFRRVP